MLCIFTSCDKNKSEAKDKSAKTTTEPTLNNDNPESEGSQFSTPKLDLYYISNLEENTGQKIGFVSLSDNYTLSDHKDSLAIPDLNGIKNNQDLKYFTLNATYRKRFLENVGISETDSLFIYNYETNTLQSFLVKNLNVAANLNAYSYSESFEEPLTQYDYEIGFGIDKSQLEKHDEYFSYTLVFVGKENPFVKGQMKPLTWKKIKSEEFPLSKSNLSDAKKKKGRNTYCYNSDKYRFFIRSISHADQSYSDRHLMITDIKTNALVIERIFKEDEGASAADLNFGISDPGNPDITDMKNQWTGKLFKNQPEVVFGFEYISFGCPGIIFLNPKMKDLDLKCDNRH